MTVIALIGAKGLYLLFAWLLSAAVAAWLAERKGYGERLGLACGLLLSVVGVLIVLVLPGRPGSRVYPRRAAAPTSPPRWMQRSRSSTAASPRRSSTARS